MPRCKSWTPLEGSTAQGQGKPGGKGRRWAPCRNRVGEGQWRCEECLRKLLAHPDPMVRAWLAAEVGQSPDVLALLATDLDYTVAGAARRQLVEG